jgi:hypothetical protein
MNKQFVVKMMQAKQMEYQALKEIMPECMVNRIENLENEFVVIAKEYFMSMMNGSSKGSDSSAKASDTKVRKVTIE